VKSEHSDHPAHASIMDLESKANGGKKTGKGDNKKKRSNTKQAKTSSRK
jgi:hypothetical protein